MRAPCYAAERRGIAAIAAVQDTHERGGSVKRVAAGFALVALLIVVAGCPNPQRITDLEKQVSDGQMKITELEGTVQTLTMTVDSLQKVIADMTAKGQSVQPGTKKTTGGGTGGREPLPPTKKGSK
jgi:uncharacterized coiled-coil protein SlyX